MNAVNSPHTTLFAHKRLFSSVLPQMSLKKYLETLKDLIYTCQSRDFTFKAFYDRIMSREVTKVFSCKKVF